MKQKVKYSAYSLILTLLGLLLFLSVTIFEFRTGNPVRWIVAGSLALLFVCALIYSPIYISVKNNRLNVHRLLHTKSILISDIESVNMCSPSMSERRILGSGGWFGYWGRFHEPSIGKYFAYYGKASDCFLVTLKDGRKYLLGCENPDSIVNCINKQ